MIERHPILFRLSAVLTAILGAALCLVALPLLGIVWMCFTGNGPGGQSDPDIKTGTLFLAIAMLGITSGLLCEWWARKAWRKGKQLHSNNGHATAHF